MENKSDRGVYLRSENAKNAICFYAVCSKKQLSDDIYIVFVILLKKLIIWTTSLGHSKFWFTISVPIKWTGILRNLFTFQFIKYKQNCSNVQYLSSILRYKEGRPHFRKPISRTLFIVINFMPFINYWKSKTIFRPL